MKLSALALALLATFSVACSDDDLDAGSNPPGAAGAPGQAITAERMDQFCTKDVARGVSCDPQDDDTVAECKQDYNCYGALLRADSLEPLLTCLETRPCGKSDDACFAEVGKSLTLSDHGSSYLSACQTRLAECQQDASPDGFGDDWCTDGDVPWRILLDRHYVAMTPCFSKACGEVGECLEDAIKPVNIDRSLCTDPSLP